jgi:hypothetical protein
MITPIHLAQVRLANKYLNLLLNVTITTDEVASFPHTDNNHLIHMCRWLITHPEMPVDKQSRWIGFIQGVLAMRGYISVDGERDQTRALFHEAYTEMGHEIPKSVGI